MEKHYTECDTTDNTMDIDDSSQMSRRRKTAIDWFAERTSMHGVPSLVKAHSSGSRVFWACVCVIGMGMFIFMLVSLILQYLSYPTVLKIEEVSSLK